LFNRYVTRIVAMVFQNEGFVTKQAGDTTLAAWNLVLDQPDHAVRAARAATEIKREIRTINLELLKENSIEIGVGVATGSVVIGRIHIPTRAEFALIGEVVTLAERMAMKTDRGVFVDPPTREVIQGEFDTRQVNPIRLRRKTDPQIVWEIVEVVEPEEEPSEEPAESVPQPN
jgi:adenylate cyclase